MVGGLIVAIPAQMYVALYGGVNLFLYKQTIEPESIIADVKYFSVMDFIPQDGSEPDYAGAVFWCLEAALGPKKVTTIFDFIFLMSFSYTG